MYLRGVVGGERKGAWWGQRDEEGGVISAYGNTASKEWVVNGIII